jgi:CspA family cold shock protein
MNTGKVKFYNKEKQFGFIKDDNSDAEYFFHHTDCLYDDMKADDHVTFKIEASKRRIGSEVAVDVKLVIT